MHEHSFIESIVGNIKDVEKVKKVVLEVGDLAGITGEHLKEHIEEKLASLAPPGVPSEEGKVEVVSKKGRIECECGFDGEPRILERMHDFVVFECPECGAMPEATQGKDIKILKVSYK